MVFRFIKYKVKKSIIGFIRKPSYSRIQLEEWLKSIDVNAERVLDVGTNFNPVADRVKNWRVNQYKILDNNLEGDCCPDFKLDLNRIYFSDKYGWRGKTNKETETLKTIFNFSPNIIFCIEVMEYIYRPETVLKFFYDVLEKNGVLYISFHTIYPVHEPYRYDSLRYTKWGIMHLLKEVNFSNWKIIPRKATRGINELTAFYKNEKMRTLKNNNLIFDTGYFVKAIKR